jgi:hypothetical protein
MPQSFQLRAGGMSAANAGVCQQSQAKSTFFFPEMFLCLFIFLLRARVALWLSHSKDSA